MPYTNIDKQHEEAEARQEARELKVIVRATQLMWCATERQLDDLAASMSAKMADRMVSVFINSDPEAKWLADRELAQHPGATLDDILIEIPERLQIKMIKTFIGSEVEARSFAHEYFMKIADKELPQ